MNRSLTLVLKLSAVAVLFTIIFYAIDWRDTYSTISADGEVITRVEGKILGDWDRDPVRFLADGANKAMTIRRESSSNGDQTTVTPGFPTYLKNLDPTFFIFGALCFFIFVIIGNARWWWLLRVNRLNVTFLEAQRFAWIGFFFNNVVPGSTGGDVVKAVYIARHCSTNRVQALVSIVIDRIIGLLSLLLIGSLAGLFALDRFPHFTILVWLVSLGAVVFCVLLLSPSLRDLVRFQQLIHRLPKKIGNIVSELDAALLHYRSHLKGITTWILVSPVTYTLFIASFFLMDQSLGVGLTLWDYFFIVPIASVVQGIPISPAGWGVGEAAYGLLISQFGATALPGVTEAEQIMRTRGVALSIIHRVHIAVWSLLGGLLLIVSRRVVRHKPPL